MFLALFSGRPKLGVFFIIIIIVFYVSLKIMFASDRETSVL
jgi:hypothetical protein